MTAIHSLTSTALLTEAGSLAAVEMRRAVERLADPVRTVAGYHLGWWDAQGTPVPAAGPVGVHLGSALVSASAQAMGAGPAAASRVAAAVELVQAASLVKFEVLDGLLTRFGRPAAWTVFGRTSAVLAGDALLVLGLSMSPFPELADASLSLISPDGAGASVEERLTASPLGALFGGACALGALCASGAEVPVLREFGYRLGLVAQLVDDLRGSRTARSSVVVAAALTSRTAAGRRLAELFDRPERMSGEEAAEAAWLVERAGGARWASQAADVQHMRALDCLVGLGDTLPLTVLADHVASHGYLTALR